jgi:nucleoside-diphosphate-sugar epimerase
MPSEPLSCLIIGCGYVGRRVATSWLAEGRRVSALTRSRAAELARLGVEPIVGDLLNRDSLRHLPRADLVLYAVGWDRTSGYTMSDVYLTGLNNALNTMPRPQHLVFVSSSSVYGQCDGEWVTESSPAQPTDASGAIVRESETILTRAIPEATILRFSGIYGQGRLLRQTALVKGEPLVGDADQWLNLIHVEDGVQAIRLAESISGDVFNIADGNPVTRRAFYTHLAELLKAPPARFEAGVSSRGNHHRRISIEKARRVLGFVPRYPSYREGLAASVNTDRS